MLELTLRLALVLLLLGGALWAWRRTQGAGPAGRGGPVLRIVGRAGLTRTSLVAVVEADGHRFLVGAAEQGVQLLASLGEVTAEDLVPVAPDATDTAEPDDDTVAAPATAWPRRLGDRPDLGTALGAVLGAHGRGTTTHDGPRIGPIDRLRGMTVRSHLREPIRVTPSDAD